MKEEPANMPKLPNLPNLPKLPVPIDRPANPLPVR
jgi:hypothetical protein